MTSNLFGSSPKVTTPPPQPTINSTQSGLQSFLANLLQSGQLPPGTTSYPGPFAAPQTQGQTNIVQQLTDLASGINPNASAGINNAGTLALGGALNFGGPPQYTAPQTSAPQYGAAPQINFNPQTPNIDATQAFTQGVVNPVTSNFLQTVIPSLNAGAGRSAGGIYGSDLAGATDQAVSNLDTTLAGQGSEFAYNAAAANQAAQEQTNAQRLAEAEANQSAQATAQGANLQSALTTNNLNTGSTLSTNSQNASDILGTEGDVLSAVGETPSISNLPFMGSANTASILDSLFPTISTPQLTAQTGISGAEQSFAQMLNEGLSLDQIMASLSTTPTQQTNTVVTPGQTGLIPGLLSGAASNPLLGYGALSSLGLLPLSGGLGVSDRRLKTDIKRVGQVGSKRKVPVYTYRFKSDPANVRRIGPMAQDVEKRVPEAAGELPGGTKIIDYGKLLDEVFPTKKAA